MSLQYIQDNSGNTTGVFIPIEQWQGLKEKHADLETTELETNFELASWQKEIIDQRLDDYYKNPSAVVDFDTTIANIRKTI